jgi:hypothetical protein
MVPPSIADIDVDRPTYDAIAASLRSDRSSEYNRAVLDPSRTLASAVAASVGAVTVSEPHGTGLAGVMDSIGLWMLDADGHAWHILLHDRGACQQKWAEHGQRMRRAERAPWRWLPGHDRVVETLAVQRSLVLDSVLPQGWEGSIEDVIAARAQRSEPWASEDLLSLLTLWTTARLIEGQSPATARFLLALRLPATALSHPIVARWRAGVLDDEGYDMQDMLPIGLG